MTTIKIKCDLTKTTELWHKIMKLLVSFDIKPYKLIPRDTFYLAHINTDNECDSLFSEPVKIALRAIECDVVTPPQIRAKRTVIISNIDQQVFNFESDIIANDLQERNPWLHIDNVYKLNKGFSIKLVCKTQQIASKCLSSGICLFYSFLPPSSIRLDEFIRLNYCFRCYSIEDHLSRDCCKPDNYKVCSLCASHDHVFRECNSNSRRCVNCDGSHGSMSFSCPRRHEVLRRMRNMGSDRQKLYASKVAVKGSQQLETKLDADELQKSIVKSHMCIFLASVAEARRPGTFQSSLNKLLAKNNLSSFEIGDLVPPTPGEVRPSCSDVTNVDCSSDEDCSNRSGSGVVDGSAFGSSGTSTAAYKRTGNCTKKQSVARKRGRPRKNH